MTPALDREASCELLEAIVRHWMHDARRDPHELHRLARFLELDPATLAARIEARPVTQKPRRRRKAAAECHVTYPTP